MNWTSLTQENAQNQVEKHLNIPLSNLCIPRNSYINRVFEMETQDTRERFIVKFYRPGRWTPDMIQNEHTLLQILAENDIPVIPPRTLNGNTLFNSNDHPFAIFPKQGGRIIDELDNKRWEEVGRLLARMHNISATLNTVNRLRWTPKIATQHHIQTILDANVLPPDYIIPFETACNRFIHTYSPFFESVDTFLIHGDCHFGNLIFRPDEGLYLIDFDDCSIGPAVQDLWMLLPGDVSESQSEIKHFLDGYHTFRDFPVSSLKLIPALQTMRQIHFASWCTIQVNDAQFKTHFPDWGSIKYWNEVIKDINDR